MPMISQINIYTHTYNTCFLKIKILIMTTQKLNKTYQITDSYKKSLQQYLFRSIEKYPLI